MQNTFDNVANTAQAHFAQAAQLGSVEAANVIYSAQYGGSGKDETPDLLKKGNGIHERNSGYLADIANMMRGGNGMGMQFGAI